MGRAAGDAGIRQVRRAGPELDLLDVEPKRIGRDLRERGPGALAHVVRADLHDAAAVAAQHRARLGLEHQRRERSRCPRPSRPAARLVAHLPRRERRRCPAEALGALRVALAQRLRGERLAGDRLDLGVVLQPEGQRVHAAGLRHLVDRALQRDRAGRLAGRAHEQRRAGVEPNAFVRRGDGRAGIERMRGVGGRLEEVVEGARRRLGVMIDRGQRAVAVGAHAQGLPRRRAMADRAVHLLAAQHQLDRPADQPRRHDAEHLRPRDEALGAEAAAEERTADVDVLRRDAEQSRDPPLRHDEALARRVDRERVAVPRRDDRVRLHRVVVLRRRLVGRLDPLRRGGEPGLDIAALHFRRIADADARRHEAFGRVEPDPRRLAVVARRQQRGAFGRRLQRLGDHHRDRLVGVAHPVVLQQVEPEHEGVGLRVRILRERRPVGRRHHLDDAGMGLRGRHVEKGDAAARDAADRQDRVEHAGRMVVGGVAGGARDFQHAVAAGERLADVRAVPDMRGRPGECDLRHHGMDASPETEAKGEAGRAGTRSACRPRRGSGRARRSAARARS